jgi:hypothetical protein
VRQRGRRVFQTWTTLSGSPFAELRSNCTPASRGLCTLINKPPQRKTPAGWSRGRRRLSGAGVIRGCRDGAADQATRGRRNSASRGAPVDQTLGRPDCSAARSRDLSLFALPLRCSLRVATSLVPRRDLLQDKPVPRRRRGATTLQNVSSASEHLQLSSTRRGRLLNHLRSLKTSDEMRSSSHPEAQILPVHSDRAARMAGREPLAVKPG